MKTFKLLFLAGAILEASPVTITTVLTSQQYQTAILGGADQATFLASFEGIDRGTKVISFSLTPQGPNWVLTATVELADTPPTPPAPPVIPPPPPVTTPPVVTTPEVPNPPVVVPPPSDEGGGPIGGGGTPPPPSNGGGGTTVPEIDPGACLNALALLTGGVLVIRGRRKTR